MKPRTIITGVAGFIGSNLADRLLSEGYHVVGIDNLSYGAEEQIPQGVEFHKMDIRSPDLNTLFEKGDIVFHLAAKNCIRDCQEDPVETASINVMGTVNVMEASCHAEVRKLIYAESSAVYEGSHLLPTPENDVHPISFYAISKLATMEFAKAYQRFYGLQTTALRYFCVYGPRQDYRRTIPPVMSAFIIKLLRGDPPIIYGDGTKRRDFVHIDDVNNFHLQCITDPRTNGGVYNIGSASNYSVRDIFDQVSRILNTHINPIHMPELPGEAQETLADISAARLLGWIPQVGLEKGLRDLAAYYQTQEIPWKIR